jgi:AmmeMemoRadiSam system protein B
MTRPLPRLRAVEAFPVDHEGERAIALRDPAGFTSSVVVLPRPLLEIVSLFDGEHTLADVQAVLMRRHGERVTAAHIESIAASLDEHGFLDSPRFAERVAAIEQEFRDAPTRAAAHAGGAYHAEPKALRQAMDAFFAPPAGPGPIGRPRPGVPVRGVIAPHIDFHRGGAGYAWAYREIGERCDADLFVIFGTCHAGLRHPFALTGKDYETPLGTARVDQEFVEALVRRSRQECFGSELGHRTEHSIEFQAVFLRYLFGRRREFTIVPVLASFAHEALARGQEPEADARVPRFLDAVIETAMASGRKVAFVAGADLAHVGPRFGDPEPVSPEGLARIEREDRAMLETVTGADATAFFESVAADGDRRRICGYSPIYALLRCLPGATGALRHYGQWPDPQAVVTHASVVLR